MIYRCQMESRNFIFEAFGSTPDEAREAFARGLHAHRAQYNRTQLAWVKEMIADTEPEPLEIGVCYRDTTKLA